MLATITGFLYLTIAVPVIAMDLTSRRIPDYLSLGGLGVLAAVHLAIAPSPAALVAAVAGAGAAAGICYGAWYLSRGGLGRGDAKYALQLGVVLPAAGVLVALFCAAVAALGAAFLFRDEGTIPFAPFLALGAVFATALAQLGVW